jgi:putative Holliday junction resolvase
MRILAVDYGDVRTGFAICDKYEVLASPLEVIRERNAQKIISRIAEIVREYEVGLVIIGNPVNMNNTLGPRSELCTRFAEMLREETDKPVELWDERITTVAANNLLNEADIRGKKRKEIIDAAAAAVLLESYLAFRKNRNV